MHRARGKVQFGAYLGSRVPNVSADGGPHHTNARVWLARDWIVCWLPVGDDGADAVAHTHTHHDDQGFSKNAISSRSFRLQDLQYRHAPSPLRSTVCGRRAPPSPHLRRRRS